MARSARCLSSAQRLTAMKNCAVKKLAVTKSEVAQHFKTSEVAQPRVRSNSFGCCLKRHASEITLANRHGPRRKWLSHPRRTPIQLFSSGLWLLLPLSSEPFSPAELSFGLPDTLCEGGPSSTTNLPLVTS